MPIVFTVSVEPVVTPSVPVAVIVPPERPLAVAIEVMPSSAAQYIEVPFECNT